MKKSNIKPFTWVILIVFTITNCKDNGSLPYSSNVNIINESGVDLSLTIQRESGVEIVSIPNKSKYQNTIEESYTGFHGPFVGSVKSLSIIFSDNKVLNFTHSDPDKKDNILWFDAYDILEISEFERIFTFRITEQHYLLATELNSLVSL
ncbi:MAG: hypothetical protein VB046_00920 [Paludibacter sp.]|nr:hypothetical protein [Paludibacter sp.]